VEQATAANAGFHATTLSDAPFGDLNEHVHSSADGLSTVPAVWNMALTTKGFTDLVVRQNTWDPGGSTGWHTHPGPSLITVTTGTLTVYDANCTPHVFSAGDAGANSAFVDVGGGDVHLVRNETSATAKAMVVQFVAASVPIVNRRIDAPAPDNCSVR
jgi:quercetin dioxygenase-like cupin family protein